MDSKFFMFFFFLHIYENHYKKVRIFIHFTFCQAHKQGLWLESQWLKLYHE